LPAKRDETAERPIPGSQAMSARLLPTAVRLAGKSALRAQSDARLTELTREGSGPAFEVIVARYRRPLLRHCAGVLGEADAEDAVQEAFAKAHAAFSRGEQVRKLGPWLYAVAHNVAVSVLRSRAARPECSEPECPEAQLVDETAEQREQLRAAGDRGAQLRRDRWNPRCKPGRRGTAPEPRADLGSRACPGADTG
jgi:hypothetical protein